VIVPSPLPPELDQIPRADADEATADPVAVPPPEPKSAAAAMSRSPFVQVSRLALYSIGALIVGASLLSFLLGFFMGRLTPSADNMRGANSPRRITGRLTYESRLGAIAADSEAVVVVLPVGREPDEKFDAMAIRPDVPRPDAHHPTILGIRSIGGDITRTRANGEFSVEVPRAGEYFVLFLSGNLQRSSDEPPTTMQIAQIAHYFRPADMLLGANAYRWEKELIREDRLIDHNFIEK
jgi:hypothetical protein